MAQNDETPVIVTGQERRHPAIQRLARACIELARLQLAAEPSEDDEPASTDSVPEEAEHA